MIKMLISPGHKITSEMFGKRGGLIFSTLDSRLSGLSSSHEHWVTTLCSWEENDHVQILLNTLHMYYRKKIYR